MIFQKIVGFYSRTLFRVHLETFLMALDKLLRGPVRAMSFLAVTLILTQKNCIKSSTVIGNNA